MMLAVVCLYVWRGDATLRLLPPSSSDSLDDGECVQGLMRDQHSFSVGGGESRDDGMVIQDVL